MLLSMPVNGSALEPQYDIAHNWHMLSCAGFGYRLEFDNDKRTFKLIYGEECPSAISTVFKGHFKLHQNKLILDFGKFQAHYYIREPYSPVCDNQKDSLTEQEIQLVCDRNQLENASEYLPKDGSAIKFFAAKTMLFLSKIEGNVKGETTEGIVKDLKTHTFIADTRN